MASPNRSTKSAFLHGDLLSCLLTLGFAFSALLALLYLSGEFGSFGFAMVFGVPFFVGVIIGHNGKISTVWKIAAGVAVLVGVLSCLVLWSVSGLLCAAISGVVMIVPLLTGALAGHAVSRWQQAHRSRIRPAITAVILFAGIAAALYAEARFTPPSATETITTTRVLELGLEEAWNSLVFYEEIGLEPPLLTRIGLPYPIRTEGGPHRIGSVTRCVYSTGYLLKRITELVPGQRLVFEVIEQKGVEDRSFELIGGRFEFERVDENRTRVVLQTRYRPFLQARFYWRPFEEQLAHQLHDYVLDGMLTNESREPRVASR